MFLQFYLLPIIQLFPHLRHLQMKYNKKLKFPLHQFLQRPSQQLKKKGASLT